MKKHFLFSVLALSLIGCKRSSDDVVPQVEVPILPVKITSTKNSSSTTDITTLKYDGTKLLEQVYSNGDKLIYTYEGDNIVSEVESYSNGSAKSQFSYDTNGRLIKIVVIYSNNTTSTTTNITWIDDNHFRYSQVGDNTNTIHDGYITNGNITKLTSTSINGATSTSNFTFGNGYNPYNNIKGYKKINIINAQYGSTNQVTKEEYSYTGPNTPNYNSSLIISHSLTLNSANFPVKDYIAYTSSNPIFQGSTTLSFEYNR